MKINISLSSSFDSLMNPILNSSIEGKIKKDQVVSNFNGWIKDSIPLKKSDRRMFFLKFVRYRLYEKWKTSNSIIPNIEKDKSIFDTSESISSILESLIHAYEMGNPKIDNYDLYSTNINTTLEAFEEYKKESADRGLIAYTGKEKIHTKYPDGFYWIQIDDGYCLKEGNAMGHCGNEPSVKDGDILFSLRKLITDKGRQFWESKYATVICDYSESLGEIRGRFNEAPNKEVMHYILDLLCDKKYFQTVDRHVRSYINKTWNALSEASEDDFFKLKQRNPKFYASFENFFQKSDGDRIGTWESFYVSLINDNNSYNFQLSKTSRNPVNRSLMSLYIDTHDEDLDYKKGLPVEALKLFCESILKNIDHSNLSKGLFKHLCKTVLSESELKRLNFNADNSFDDIDDSWLDIGPLPKDLVCNSINGTFDQTFESIETNICNVQANEIKKLISINKRDTGRKSSRSSITVAKTKIDYLEVTSGVSLLRCEVNEAIAYAIKSKGSNVTKAKVSNYEATENSHIDTLECVSKRFEKVLFRDSTANVIDGNSESLFLYDSTAKVTGKAFETIVFDNSKVDIGRYKATHVRIAKTNVALPESYEDIDTDLVLDLKKAEYGNITISTKSKIQSGSTFANLTVTGNNTYYEIPDDIKVDTIITNKTKLKIGVNCSINRLKLIDSKLESTGSKVSDLRLVGRSIINNISIKDLKLTFLQVSDRAKADLSGLKLESVKVEKVKSINIENATINELSTSHRDRSLKSIIVNSKTKLKDANLHNVVLQSTDGIVNLNAEELNIDVMVDNSVKFINITGIDNEPEYRFSFKGKNFVIITIGKKSYKVQANSIKDSKVYIDYSDESITTSNCTLVDFSVNLFEYIILYNSNLENPKINMDNYSMSKLSKRVTYSRKSEQEEAVKIMKPARKALPRPRQPRLVKL